jgi:TRAP-type C4-dicarboxylate transport system permease large subunit
VHGATAPAGPLRTWLTTVPILVILVVVVLHGSGVMLHGQLLRAGESMFQGYSELRSDPVAPTCDPDAIGRPKAEATGAENGDDFLDDLFGDEGVGEAPAPAEAGDDFLDALFEDDAPDGGGAGGAEDDFLDDLFGEPSGGAARGGGPSEAAIAAARAECIAAHEAYASRVERITGRVRTYRGFERSVASLVRWGDEHKRHMLVLLILICGVTATGLRAHIALRPVSTVRDDRVSQIGQLGANLALLVSSTIKWRIDQGSGLELQHASLPLLWMAGFSAMAAMNVRHLLRPPPEAEPGGGIARSLLTVPLYAIMGWSAAIHFFVFELHPAGPAIYLQKLTENAKLYVQVGLYVWAGMLLKRTRIATLFFDIVRPWKLPPELLAPLVVAVAAVPTAYSGASGIFVIAAGAVIYDELRRAGARRQLALAATAMSGSLGVVLSPCLLVVVVAAMNNEVTTTELYGWGWRVFALSASLFLVFCILSRREPFTMAPLKEAVYGSLFALRPLVPYVLIGVAVLAFYALVLGTRVNEHTAPTVLPILLLLLLFYDRWSARSGTNGAAAITTPPAEEAARSLETARPMGYGRSLVSGTDEATAHCGALLLLMGLSMSVGGVIERGDLMTLVPQAFGSVWVAMMVMVVLLVVVGMIMDPYGAVILVSVTVAPIAYSSGIHPLHFWMVVLAAFELGYLTPPVALNHLLTRQVVRAEPEVDAAETSEGSFWRRHERVMMPLTVMAIALVLVGFVPLFFY